jgi:hypothetical protein
MNWQTPISKHEKGEVGRVYYLNQMVILKSGEEWTQHTPMTLNPDRGGTVELYLKKSVDVPQPLKASLLSQRKAEAKLSSGLVVRYWISDYPAPEYWAPTDAQKAAKLKSEDKPVLFNAQGRVI